MTKSERFNKAWNIAREAAVKFGGSSKKYFAEALKMTYAPAKTTVADIEVALLAKGLKVWELGSLRRIYINGYDELVRVLGYKGYSSKAFIREMDNKKHYFDCNTGDIVTDIRTTSCEALFADYCYELGYSC